MTLHPTEILSTRHPCYSAEAKHLYSRMHLPVAPACNIQCNYCNRLFDCQNESRPGVTSEILTPQEALAKVRRVSEVLPSLSVLGIAGPGDALANWELTRGTVALVRKEFPELLLCLSTNGLMLPTYADDVIALGVRHMTVTVNAIDVEIAEKIYEYITWQGNKMRGRKAVQLLLENQIEGIRILAAAGVQVKVNTVMISDINDKHVPAIAKTVRSAGACMTNIMPLIPAEGSKFGHLPKTRQDALSAMRDTCAEIIPQMRHCQQCRADAIGLLHQDRSVEFRDRGSACSGGGCNEDRLVQKAG